MPHHKALTIEHGIHGILAGTIANETNLNAGIVNDSEYPDGRAVTIEDVGKVFQRLDNGAWYGLFNLAPVNWWVISSGALNAFEHGDLPGGTLHAVATTTVNGFYASSDKVLNDNHRSDFNNPHQTTAQQVGAISTANTMAVTGTPTIGQVLTATSTTTATWQAPASGGISNRTLNAGNGLTGGGDLSADRVFNVGAPPDGSIAVNADSIQVGTLATDAQHGNRGGGAQHALATAATAGFMSPADKNKLDTSVSTPLSNLAPQPLGTATPGVLLESARIDHVHAHGNQPGASLHALATAAVAGFMSAADKTKLDTISTSIFARLAGGNSFTGNQQIVGNLALLGEFATTGGVQATNVFTGAAPTFQGDIWASRDLRADIDVYSVTGNVYATAGKIYTGVTAPPSVGDIRAGNNLIAANLAIASGFQISPVIPQTRIVNAFSDAQTSQTTVTISSTNVQYASWHWDSATHAWVSNISGPTGSLFFGLDVPHFGVLNRVRVRMQPSAARSGTSKMAFIVLAVDFDGNTTSLATAVQDDGTTNLQTRLLDNIGYTLNKGAFSIVVAIAAGGTGGTATLDRVFGVEYTFTADQLIPG
jgi:hypothetical protein